MRRKDTTLIRLAMMSHSAASLSIVVLGVYTGVVLKRLAELIKEGRYLLEQLEN